MLQCVAALYSVLYCVAMCHGGGRNVWRWVGVGCSVLYLSQHVTEGCTLIAGGAGTSNLYTRDHISEIGLFREWVSFGGLF